MIGQFGIWITSWLGKDKLAQNLTPTERTRIVNTSKNQGNEDETEGRTYDNIIETLREKAIESEPISMVANAFAKGVYGSEVSIQNISDNEIVNDEYERIIRLFCKFNNFTLSEQYHFNFWARFAPEIYIRDGGFIVRKHKISPKVAKARNYKLPYRIEFIEISQINFTKNDSILKIYNGVQIDEQGKPIYLYFKGGKAVSFNELILFSKTTRISQLNGISLVYPSLQNIARQEQHAKAEVKNATEQAKTSDVYKTKIAPTLQIKAQGDFDADLLNANTVTREVSPKMPEKEAKLINIDEDYVRLSRGSYSSAFETLNNFVNTRIAAGSGITIDEYTNDLSNLTFHGGKEATIRNQETYRGLRNDMDNLVWIPIFEDLLNWCYITGHTNIQPTEDNCKIILIKKPRESNQPSQDATAFEKNYKNGFVTIGDVVKKISGEPLSEYLKRHEREESQKLEVEIKLATKRKELSDLQQGSINEK